MAEVMVQNQKVTKTQEVIDIIERDGVVTVQELSFETDLTVQRVRGIISYINKRHLSHPDKVPHIYTTGKGYSIEQKKEYSVFETGYRMKSAFGILSNGMPAFRHCKLVAPKAFAAIRANFNPSSLTLNKLLTKKGK